MPVSVFVRMNAKFSNCKAAGTQGVSCATWAATRSQVSNSLLRTCDRPAVRANVASSLLLSFHRQAYAQIELSLLLPPPRGRGKPKLYFMQVVACAHSWFLPGFSLRNRRYSADAARKGARISSADSLSAPLNRVHGCAAPSC